MTPNTAGFGSAPKFPSAHDLIFLQRYAYHTGDKAAKEELENTLRQMYKGGIYDHFGGGFARYSTDREWLAPHFEKTLYDNAMLALCYTEAWQNSRMALYRQVAEATLDYCLRELRADSGGFYCWQDSGAAAAMRARTISSPQPRSKSCSARTTGGTSASATTSPMRAISTGRVSRICC